VDLRLPLGFLFYAVFAELQRSNSRSVMLGRGRYYASALLARAPASVGALFLSRSATNQG